MPEGTLHLQQLLKLLQPLHLSIVLLKPSLRPTVRSNMRRLRPKNALPGLKKSVKRKMQFHNLSNTTRFVKKQLKMNVLPLLLILLMKVLMVSENEKLKQLGIIMDTNLLFNTSMSLPIQLQQSKRKQSKLHAKKLSPNTVSIHQKLKMKQFQLNNATKSRKLIALPRWKKFQRKFVLQPNLWFVKFNNLFLLIQLATVMEQAQKSKKCAGHNSSIDSFYKK